MNKKVITVIGVIFVLASLYFLIKSENVTGNVVLDNKIIMGYCPSMTEEALKISQLNKNIILEQKSSAADALNSLDNGELDIALVGRIAKHSEIDNSEKRVLDEGYTLVSNTKKFIQKSELKSLIIHTYLDEEIVGKLIPEAKIIYHSDLESTLKYGINEAAIIDWKDYSDDMELFVVLDGQLKAKEFRIPVLYSKTFELEKLKV